MGKDLAEEYPEAKAVFDEVDEAIGAPLSRLCFEGPADELTATHNAQPALLAHGAAVWRVVKDRIASLVCAAAGHSLGEHTAYHAAGSTSLADAAKLVRRRGELMYRTGIDQPGAMAAILGKLDDPIDSLCEQATRDAGTVVAANYNTAEQIVVSGEVAGVERLMDLAKKSGAKRAMRLPVSGAFHSPLMEPAVPGFSAALGEASFADPAFPVYSNVTTKECRTAREAKDLLAKQLTAPVRWAEEVSNMAGAFGDVLFVEMGPGNVLTGLGGRIVPGARGIACGTPADIDRLLTQLTQ
jgi:[acyl-carrier-protein] S-malonyltransferase